MFLRVVESKQCARWCTAPCAGPNVAVSRKVAGRSAPPLSLSSAILALQSVAARPERKNDFHGGEYSCLPPRASRSPPCSGLSRGVEWKDERYFSLPALRPDGLHA